MVMVADGAPASKMSILIFVPAFAGIAAPASMVKPSSVAAIVLMIVLLIVQVRGRRYGPSLGLRMFRGAQRASTPRVEGRAFHKGEAKVEAHGRVAQASSRCFRGSSGRAAKPRAGFVAAGMEAAALRGRGAALRSGAGPATEA